MKKPQTTPATANARIVLEAVSRKKITAQEGSRILSEAAFTPTAGSPVVISHGIGAGSQGVFQGESNGGYGRVKTTAGVLQVPMIFLGPNVNK